MVKVFVNDWNKLEEYVKRIQEAALTGEVTVEATIMMNDENAEKMWVTKLQKVETEETEEVKKVEIKEIEVKQEQKIDTIKEVLSYFKERPGKNITQKELIENIGITQSKTSYAIQVLQAHNRIEKVERGKYRFIKRELPTYPINNLEVMIPEAHDNLKFLYLHYPEYKKIIDYIYTKTEVDADSMEEVFKQEESILWRVLEKSKQQGFISFMKKIQGDSCRYQVNNIGKVWYRLLQSSKTVEKLYFEIGTLSKKKIEMALEEGIKKGFISMKKDKFSAI